MKSILGISAFYHDSAAALIIDGKIVAAAQEERFTRIKHDSSYPFNAINFVLSFGGIKISEIDSIVEEGHNYRREIQLTYTFTEDSVATNEGEYESYSISNDTLNLQYWSPRFELIDDIFMNQ